MKNDDSFVGRIDALLKTKKKNRNDIYNDLSISKNLIGQWTQKGTIPSADTACKIADYLNTSVEFLVTGIEKDSSKVKYENLKSVIKNEISVIQNAINEN